MDDQSAPAEPIDARVQAALADYLERVDRGEAVNAEAFLAERGEIAKELRSFIDAEEQLRKLAAGERAADSTQVFALHGNETIAPRAGTNRSSEGDTGGLKQEFGRYRIVRILGKGAMGAVYLAEDTQLQRQVALKTPHFEQEPTAELLERFYREARAAATLRHPNICPVYDVGQIEDTHYISMAYIEGHPLSAFIRASKPQPERQILIVVRKLAQALQEAHDHGIVHRDLKPANVMVDKRNEPIIMDFGLARQLQGETNIRITQSGMLIGTPAYMSPEQVDGEIDKVGPHSDQYSLGVILYELLTGQLPFRGSLTAVMAQILTKETPSPGQLRSGLDPRIDAACLKMMAKDPAARFASLAAVVEELAAILRTPGAKQPSKEATRQTGRATPPADSNAPTASVLQSQTKKTVSGKDLASLEELALKCLGRHDYDQVIQIVERIPDEKRNAGLAAVLEKAREKADEIAFLICEIDEAVRFNDHRTALRKADDLLALKPGHHRALKVQEEFAGYGEGGAARLGSLRQFTQPWNEGGWIPWSVLAFGLAVFGGLTAIIVIYLNKTTIEVDIKDPEVAVSVKGKEIAIIGPNDERIVVEPGPQELSITYAGLETKTTSFSLKKGDKKTVTVSIVNKEIVAKLDNEALSLTRPPDKDKDENLSTTGKVAAKNQEGRAQQASIDLAKQPSTKTLEKTQQAAGESYPSFLVVPFDEQAALKARHQWAEYLKQPAELVNSIGMKLVLVPPGNFSMGSPPRELGRADDEDQVSVMLTRPFWLCDREVSQAEWERVMNTTPWVGHSETATGKNYPANFLDWNQAVLFCRELTKFEGRAGRLPDGFEYALPSEAQWEYACRAGTTTSFCYGDDDSRLGDFAWFRKNALLVSQGYPHEVATKMPNAFGLYDMHGNVFEWCRDVYGKLPGGRDPENSGGGPVHAMRGGCVVRPASDCRSASRGYDTTSNRFARLGMRVALTMTPTKATKLAAILGAVPYRGLAPFPVPRAVENENGLLRAPFDESAARQSQKEWSERLKSPVEATNTIGMRLRLIPPGEFQMGSDSREDRKPHIVRITHPLYFGIYEVTRGEFDKFARESRYVTAAEKALGGWRLANTDKKMKWEPHQRHTWRKPGFKQDNNHPVIDITWNDATAFCAWLLRIEGKSYRLPTEAEWEYACRAGTTSRMYNGNLAEDLTQIGNVADAKAKSKYPAWQTVQSSDGWTDTSPVGLFRPNNFGIHDTIGNAMEWCSDWYGKDYYQNSPETDPTGPASGQYRVLRGGSYVENASSTSRFKWAIDHHAPDSGFRVVCEIAHNPSTPEVSTATASLENQTTNPTKKDARRLWKGSDSSFENTEGTKWHETFYKPSRGNNFDEVARTVKYVEIVDPTRGMHIRLTNQTAQWRIVGKGKSWGTFQNGSWAPQTASASGPAADRRAAVPEKK